MTAPRLQWERDHPETPWWKMCLCPPEKERRHIQHRAEHEAKSTNKTSTKQGVDSSLLSDNYLYVCVALCKCRLTETQALFCTMYSARTHVHSLSSH